MLGWRGSARFPYWLTVPFASLRVSGAALAEADRFATFSACRDTWNALAAARAPALLRADVGGRRRRLRQPTRILTLREYGARNRTRTYVLSYGAGMAVALLCNRYAPSING
jgi:hypothetical protein